jgi:hypothetical protein
MIACVAGAMLLAGTGAKACGPVPLQPDASSAEAAPKDASKDQQRGQQETK